MIQTARLLLRPWQSQDRVLFAELHSDPEVMADLGGPIGRASSDQKFERYRDAYQLHGLSRWAVEEPALGFVGYAGIYPRLSAEHPLGSHYEIGWRFHRVAWGRGYATESAKAALGHAFETCGLPEILSYTSPDNLRSMRVMQRLNLQRDPSRDFVADYGGGQWQGLVWFERAENWSAPGRLRR